jgi:hypothetical protein
VCSTLGYSSTASYTYNIYVLQDIRETPDDRYWEELRRRWTGLLSYRYLGRSHGSLNSGVVDNTMRLRHDMRNPAGGVMAAPLCIAAPEGGGLADDVAVPNPVIQSLQVLYDARDVARIEVVSEVLKQGRQMGFSRSRIVDADRPERVIALTEGEGISLGGTPPGFEKMKEDKIEVQDSRSLPPLWKVFGASRRPDGHWALPELSIETASPDAALHLGPQHILLETAAVELASEVAGTDRLQVQSWHVMFLARGKVGPFRADGEAIAGSAGRLGVRLTVVDEGNGGRPITAGSAVFTVAER